MLERMLVITAVCVSCGGSPSAPTDPFGGDTSTPGGGTASTLGGGTASTFGGGVANLAGGGASTSRHELVSGTRLKAVVLKSADGASAPIAGTEWVFWDSLLETYCNVGGSETVCVPRSGTNVGFFSDANCTQRLITLPGLSQLPGLPTAKVAEAFVATDGGTGTSKYFRVGPAFTGSVFSLYIGRCSSLQAGTERYFQAGAEVPLSDFASFQFAIEP